MLKSQRWEHYEISYVFSINNIISDRPIAWNEINGIRIWVYKVRNAYLQIAVKLITRVNEIDSVKSALNDVIIFAHQKLVSFSLSRVVSHLKYPNILKETFFLIT